jgi:ABC-type glycerol-3-phosphate transport system substrate-binding protein
MKKLLSILLVAILTLSLCGAAMADDQPIELLFWTTRASGAQATVVNHEVDTFNETIGKEKGIHITHEAQAGYPESWAAFSTASGSVAPDVVALGNTYIPYALDEGMLADVTGMEGADALRANLMDWVLDIAGNKDGELHSFPYIRSTPVLYYNKDIADELGITIPEQITIEQLELQLRANLDDFWQAYQNNLMLLELQEQNLKAAQETMEIAQERYLLGNLSGLEMREAQKSLLDAEESLLQAQYDTKVCEISLLQISGRITQYLE